MIIMSKVFEFELTPNQILELNSKVTNEDIRHSLQLSERMVRVLPSTGASYEYVLTKEEA